MTTQVVGILVLVILAVALTVTWAPPLFTWLWNVLMGEDVKINTTSNKVQDQDKGVWSSNGGWSKNSGGVNHAPVVHAAAKAPASVTPSKPTNIIEQGFEKNNLKTGDTKDIKVAKAPIIPVSYSKPVKAKFASTGDLVFEAKLESANFARLSLNFMGMSSIRNFNMTKQVTETVFAIFFPEKMPKIKPIGKKTDTYKVIAKGDLNPTEDTNGLQITSIIKI